jgi:chaperonin cofactor prefoldin
MSSLWRFSGFVFASLLFTIVFSINQPAQAQATIGSCSSANASGASTADGAFTIGQSFTVPAGDIALKSFTFYVASPTSAPLSLRFYVYAWKGTVVNGEVVEGLETQGTALFRSEPVVVSSADFQEVTINTNELPVSPGARYILIVSNWEATPPFPALSIKTCDPSTDPYEAGFLTFYTAPPNVFPNIADWTLGSWNVAAETAGSDLSFSASFTSIQQVIDNLQNQINTLTVENQTLQNQVNDLTGLVQSLQMQVNTLNGQVQTLTSQNQTLQNQVNSLTQTINTLNAQLQQLQGQLNQSQAGINALLNSLEADFRKTFNNPNFTIPGATPQQRLQNLINALISLNKGRKEGIYQSLGGK